MGESDQPAEGASVMAGIADTVPRLLYERASSTPRSVALRYKRGGIWHDVTWHSYLRKVAGMASQLESQGVRDGEAVAVMVSALAEWTYSVVALQSLGARALVLYQDQAIDDVIRTLTLLRVRTAIVDEGDRLNAALRERGHTFDRLLVVGRDGDERATGGDGTARPGTGVKPAEVADAPEVSFERYVNLRSAEEVAVLFQTAGASGPPKVVAHSSRTLIAATRQLVRGFELEHPLDERDEVVVEMPSGHIGATLLAIMLPLVCGARAYLPEGEVSEAVREVHPTFCLSPTWEWERTVRKVRVAALSAGRFRRWAFEKAERARRRGLRGQLWRRPARSRGGLVSALAYAVVFVPLLRSLGLERVRCVLVSGRISLDLIALGRVWGLPMYCAYGTTEVGVEVALLDGHGLHAAHGEGDVHRRGDGSLLVRGPSVCIGYVAGPEITPATDSAGWLPVGDVTIDHGGQTLLVPGTNEGEATELADLTEAEAQLRASPYIVTAAAVRDGPVLGAIINLDPRAMAAWASRTGARYELAPRSGRDPAVSALLETELMACNTRLAQRGLGKIAKLAYGSEALSILHELTPVWTVRRGRVRLPESWAVDGSSPSPKADDAILTAEV